MRRLTIPVRNPTGGNGGSPEPVEKLRSGLCYAGVFQVFMETV